MLLFVISVQISVLVIIVCHLRSTGETANKGGAIVHFYMYAMSVVRVGKSSVSSLQGKTSLFIQLKSHTSALQKLKTN